jgi:catechol 2,3-dioxygenase-like lactoylglutathione lyase family enzyme
MVARLNDVFQKITGGYMRIVRALSLVAAGVVIGMFMMQPTAAQQEKVKGLRLNHVGIYAKNFEESYNFYTKTMGFREAFSFKDKDGKPTLTYLQINRDTFLELAPATAERPAGLSHMGLWADDLNGTVAALRAQGVKVDDPRTATTKAPLTNVIDPNGVRVELLDLGPDSLHRKAMDAWK